MKQSAFANWITRITFILGLVIEIIEFLDEWLGADLMGPHHKDVAKFGALLFLISIFSWLEASHKSLAKLESMSGDLKRLTAESGGRDIAARYGANATWLLKLLHTHEMDGAHFSHLRAGGQTLSQLLLDTYSETAQSFYTLKETKGGSLRIQEQSVINLFLLNLVKSLPDRSIWLGTSQLQDVRAWDEHSAEANYHRFEQEIENRVTDSSLSCFRLFCYEDVRRLEQMSPVLWRQAEIGIQVRSLLKHPLPTDMTLIWVAKQKSPSKLDFSDPIRFLEQHFEPLCGLQFEIRNEAEVSKMTLSGPNSTDFENLKISFSRVWSKADSSKGIAA